jgi:hypothetical protein
VGKGKLARALGVLNAGAHPAVITEGHSEEETEKRIATAVLQGAPAILFDNLQRHVASSTLESMLTEPVADIRTFGKLSSLRVACRALVLLTANNATLRRDMLRRTLPVRLVVPDERPEIRRFDFCPVEEAARDRAELIAAAFTVVLAWLRARDREENRVHRKPLGSFEAWADLVAGAVSWLTGRNPIDLIEERKDQDPYAADERRVIAALVEEYGDGWWTAGEAAEAIAPDVWAGAIRLKGDRPGARDVAYWLGKRKDRVFDGRMLVNKPDRKGVARWSLPGMPGMAGDNPQRRAKNGSEDEGEDAISCDGYGNIPGHPRHPRQSADEPEGEDVW